MAEFDAVRTSYLQYGFLDNEGYLTGAATSLANGADSAMARLRGFRSLPLQPAAPVRVSQNYDGGVGNSYTFPSRELPNGDLVMGVWNPAFAALAQGTLQHTIGGVDVGVLQPDDPNFAPMVLIASTDAKRTDSGSVGNKGYMTVIYPKVEAVPTGVLGLNENDTPADFGYGLVATKTDVMHTGLVVSDTNFGTTGTPIFGPFWTEGILTCHAFNGDNSEDEITLDYTPISGTVAVYVDGVLQVLTTDYTLAGAVVTGAAAWGTGEKVRVWYQRAL